MDARKKRALLAHVEGQLAAMDRAVGATDERWQRISWALAALAQLSLTGDEARYLSRLQHHVTRMQRDNRAQRLFDTLRHRRTLVRADCVLWQLHLRRQRALANTNAA